MKPVNPCYTEIVSHLEHKIEIRSHGAVKEFDTPEWTEVYCIDCGYGVIEYDKFY